MLIAYKYFLMKYYASLEVSQKKTPISLLCSVDQKKSVSFFYILEGSISSDSNMNALKKNPVKAIIFQFHSWVFITLIKNSGISSGLSLVY